MQTRERCERKSRALASLFRERKFLRPDRVTRLSRERDTHSPSRSDRGEELVAVRGNFPERSFAIGRTRFRKSATRSKIARKKNRCIMPRARLGFSNFRQMPEAAAERRT